MAEIRAMGVTGEMVVKPVLAPQGSRKGRNPPPSPFQNRAIQVPGSN
jgi:hypothetical protein